MTDRTRLSDEGASVAQWRAAYESLQKSHRELEEQLMLMQNLQSASAQFLNAKTPQDVVGVITEVLENLVCATAFTILIWRPREKRAQVLLKRGPPTPKEWHRAIGAAFQSERPAVIRGPDGTFRAAVAPARHGGRFVGAIIVEDLVPQKGGKLSDTDVELLALLAGQAGPALANTADRARAEGQLAVVRRLLTVDTGHDAALAGNLADTKIVEVLQLVGMVRKSGRLAVTTGARKLEFYFVGGSVVEVHIDGSKLALSDAPAVLSTWVDVATGAFEFYAEPPDDEPVVRMTCDEMVMEAFRLYDERNAGRSGEILS